MLKIGDTINGYEITEVKNNGEFCNSFFVKKGTGEYFLKEYTSPRQSDPLFDGFFKNQEVIIKRLNEMGSITEKFVDRFIEDSTYYQVKEMLHGIDLSEYFNSHSDFSDRKHLSIILCGVLRSLHSKNIVHQDLKPQQIMLVDDELGRKTKIGYRIILSDFDWSIPDGKFLQPVGTPFYESPEHYRNQTPTEKSDIFTLGVMIIEMLTGQNPFYFGNDESPSDEELSKRVLSKKIFSEPRKLQDEITEDINNILLKCLEVNPDKRPTIDEIQGALIGAKHEESSVKPAGSGLSKFTLRSGSSKLIVYENKNFDRSTMKIFFKDILDSDGDPIYKYFDSEKPMLVFCKDSSAGFTVNAPEKTKNYFLLNDIRIEEKPMPVKTGDKLYLYSSSLSKIVGALEVSN